MKEENIEKMDFMLKLEEHQYTDNYNATREKLKANIRYLVEDLKNELRKLEDESRICSAGDVIDNYYKDIAILQNELYNKKNEMNRTKRIRKMFNDLFE